MEGTVSKKVVGLFDSLRARNSAAQHGVFLSLCGPSFRPSSSGVLALMSIQGFFSLLQSMRWCITHGLALSGKCLIRSKIRIKTKPLSMMCTRPALCLSLPVRAPVGGRHTRRLQPSEGEPWDPSPHLRREACSMRCIQCGACARTGGVASRVPQKTVAIIDRRSASCSPARSARQ